MELEDQVAIVTGASSGIGRGIALRFAEEGCAVVNADINAAPKPSIHFERKSEVPTHQLIQSRDGDSIFVETDVGDHEQCRSLVEESVETFGGIDILVNNAGIHVPGSVDELTPDDWERVLSVNLSGQFYCAKYALPYLRDSEGSLINISSVHAIDGGAGPAYCATKAGILNMTKDLAFHYAEHNVNVNAICPGQVETPMNNYLDEEELVAAEERTPLPRVGTPDDIAGLAVFLSSAASEWITGESVFIDGGLTTHR